MAERRGKKSSGKKTGPKTPAGMDAASGPQPANAAGARLERPSISAPESGALAAILMLAAALRVWHLDRNGFGNTYYAAAVRSMLQSRHNFFFVSFDPAGWVTVDKPPLALWIQTASAKIFGFGGLSILLPQAVEGVAGVALLYFLVRRNFDRVAALGAALVLALMPLSVAVDRYNNVDACLVFVLLLTAWAVSLAVESGERGWLLAAAVLSGLAFNTKMLMGFIFLPAFYAVYLFGAPGSLRRRMKELGLASVVLALVSLSWIVTVDRIPAGDRPFVGSSKGNSMVELSFMGWNGLQRFSRTRGRGAVDDATAEPAGAAHPVDPGAQAAAGPRMVRPRRGGGRFMGGGPPGLWRLADPEWAAQVLWLLPLALLGMAAAWRRGSKAGVPEPVPQDRKGAFSAPLRAARALRQGLVGRPDRQSLLFWGAWLAIHALVFSTFSVVHTYYLVLLAPAVAALTGIGLRALWLEYRDGGKTPLPVVLLVTALWQEAILAQNPDWSGALLPLLAGGSTLAALGLAKGWKADPDKGVSWPRVSVAVGVVALLVCPLGWALTPALSPTGDGSVQADPTLVTGAVGSDAGPGPWGMRQRGGGAGQSDALLLKYLLAHRGRAKYLVAAQSSQAVTPLIIASGEPAVSLGGFMGGDPIVDVDQFSKMVDAGDFHYFLLMQNRRPAGPGPGETAGGGAWGPWGGGHGGGKDAQLIAQWVRTHGRPVDPSLWRTPEPTVLYQAAGHGGFFGGRDRNAGLQLYAISGVPNAPGTGFARHRRHRHWSRDWSAQK
jgi:4-amino-4-deoxy-L-arabinose transferase-like glycosyltransferase